MLGPIIIISIVKFSPGMSLSKVLTRNTAFLHLSTTATSLSMGRLQVVGMKGERQDLRVYWFCLDAGFSGIERFIDFRV